MRKVACIFAISVLAPSLVLAWLAIRSLSAQQIVFERQQTLLYQGVCDGLVKDIIGFLSQRRRDFAHEVESLLSAKEALEVARNFDRRILAAWPLAEVGFAVTLDGQVLSPSLLDRQQARRFRLENDAFLSNKESVEVYWRSPKGDIPLVDKSPSARSTEGAGESKGNPGKGDKSRTVSPQKEPHPEGKSGSRVSSEEAEFKQLIGESTDGVLARFLQNELTLLVWYRSPRTSNLVFGASLKLNSLKEALRPIVQPERPLRSDVCVALLDEHGRPVARSHPGFATEWKRPFVSAAIGEALPHWEVAAYPLNPAEITQSARTLALTLGLLIVVLLLAIGIGGGLLVADLRRQLLLGRQKTDFVSNVSHELKTPLTSIRMFSELLAEGRVTDPAKHQTYLNVIASEAGRLTRLINNVLDFARLERGEQKYRFDRVDFASSAREVAETYRPQFEAAGFRYECQWPETPVLVLADRDAISQVILNLLSNVEKYSGARKEVLLQLRAEVSEGDRSFAELRVLDRGPGVPHRLEEKVFEQFFRAHDSLSSGISGSGLGLTLARQIARAHGGDVLYEHREGGGSCFVFRLPT